MDRRQFLKSASGLFVPAMPALIIPKALAQVGGLSFPGPGPIHVAGGGSEQTVLIDAISDGTPNIFASGNGVTTSGPGGGSCINIGSGPNGTSNRCLIVIVLFGSQNGGTSTVTDIHWDPSTTNQAMTLVPGSKTNNGAAGGDIEAWYLMAPTIGDLSLRINWTGANQVGLAFASFVNVDQTGGTTSFPVVNVSTASGKTINISTSPTTRKLIGGFSSGSNFTTATDNDIGKNNTMSNFAVAAEYAPGTNTLVSYGAGGSGCSVAVAIKGA